GVDRGAFADLPPAGVAENADPRVLHGTDQPPGHLCPRLGEVRVDRGDGQVEVTQDLRWPVNLPAGVDVELGTVQQGHPSVLAVHAAHPLALGEHLLDGHSLYEQVRCVVGDRVIGVAACGGSRHHRLEAGGAVGQIGVRMQVTAQVVHGHQ